MSLPARSCALLPSDYDEACAALGRIVQHRNTPVFELHAALARLARTARAERVPPRQVLACLHALIAKSPLAEANRGADGAWYSGARRLVATEYYI